MQIFENSPASGGAQPPGPPTRPAKTLNPPRNFFLRTPLISWDRKYLNFRSCCSGFHSFIRNWLLQASNEFNCWVIRMILHEFWSGILEKNSFFIKTLDFYLLTPKIVLFLLPHQKEIYRWKLSKWTYFFKILMVAHTTPQRFWSAPL